MQESPTCEVLGVDKKWGPLDGKSRPLVVVKVTSFFHSSFFWVQEIRTQGRLWESHTHSQCGRDWMLPQAQAISLDCQGSQLGGQPCGPGEGQAALRGCWVVGRRPGSTGAEETEIFKGMQACTRYLCENSQLVLMKNKDSVPLPTQSFSSINLGEIRHFVRR